MDLVTPHHSTVLKGVQHHQRDNFRKEMYNRPENSHSANVNKDTPLPSIYGSFYTLQSLTLNFCIKSSKV